MVRDDCIDLAPWGVYADLTDNSVYNFRGVIEKNGLFTDRLTVRVDPPPPLPSSFFVHFFGVCLTLDYDYMYYDTADPPPPYGQTDCKNTVFLRTF